MCFINDRKIPNYKERNKEISYILTNKKKLFFWNFAQYSQLY